MIDDNEFKEIIKLTRTKDFTFVKCIGRGGFGETLLVHDEMISEDVVIKKFAPAQAVNEGQLGEVFGRFIDEIKILMHVNNPNIVRIFNYYLYESVLTGYIVMEYIQASSIEDYIKSNPENINKIFVQAIEVFTYLEEIKILHRDIRSENLLVSDKGILKLIDFGFSKICHTNNQENSVLLNHRFLSDEMLDEKYTVQSEIFCLGCLFKKLIEDYVNDGFLYTDILLEMTPPEPKNRADNFSGLLAKVDAITVSAYETDDDISKIYVEFADDFQRILANRSYSAELISDLKIVEENMDKYHRTCKYEEYVQDRAGLIRCFVLGGFSYTTNFVFNASNFKEFYKMFKKGNETLKRDLLENLKTRFDKVSLENSEDHTPF